jgi:hypothetical protein
MAGKPAVELLGVKVLNKTEFYQINTSSNWTQNEKIKA